MCARTTQIEPGNGTAVLGATWYRAHEEKLLEREVSVENISLGKPINALQIERCEYLPRHNRSRHIGSIFGDLLYHSDAEQFTVLIKVAYMLTVWHILQVAVHDDPVVLGK